ncbi:hypothetical protein [Psychromonas sp. SA13A]|uniref:hypothetical protein n=1 Tax=Psychromonas sp. SA13A TaxID=2686346 RepID=UPI00140811B5|nr:hypothetical protein [Psychromonas sp. SA13A]
MPELDIAFKISDQIITFWQFYVAGIASLVGWVFSRNNAWARQKRIGVGISAAIFLSFSFEALYKTINSLTKIVNILDSKCTASIANIDYEVYKASLERLDQGGLLLNLGFHLLADFIVLYLIFIVSKNDPITGQ